MKKRILIVNPSRELSRQVSGSRLAKRYHILAVETGSECLRKVGAFKPDLVVLDFLLRDRHAVEVTRQVKAISHTIGVIISTDHLLIQNTHAARKSGADFVTSKKITAPLFFELAEQFFLGKMKPEKIVEPKFGPRKGEKIYMPTQLKARPYLRFLGTRGSSPVSGAHYSRFGGNTSCLEVSDGERRIIIDAGTGIHTVGDQLYDEGVKEIHLFISHTHWDHIIGLPLFAPLYTPGMEVHLWSPVGFEKSTQELLTEIFAYAYFPVRLEEIKAKLIFHDLHPDEPTTIGKMKISTTFAYHPGATLCFKIDVRGKQVGYITDNEVLMGYHGNPLHLKKESAPVLAHADQIAFFKGCDLFIHEAQYTPLEYQSRVGWGHSSVANVALLLKHCRIKKWIATHHDPRHTDDELQAKRQLHMQILSDLKIPCTFQMAYDGLEIQL
jgi:phosphoribosyl 1,2-cyclic phosphodiesterase